MRLLEAIRRFIQRLAERRRSRQVDIEISPEAQVEIERWRGPRWPF